MLLQGGAVLLAIVINAHAVVPYGVQYELEVSSLGPGWQVHYEQPYSHATTLANMQPGHGECMLWAARRTPNASKLSVAAVGRRQRVETRSRFWENGVYWYTEKNVTAGFAGSQSILVQRSADLEASKCDSRLSWLLHPYGGGYRAGCTTDLSRDWTWQKVVMSGPCNCADGLKWFATGGSICVPYVGVVPRGVQYNFDPSSLGQGWQVHYEEPYRHPTNLSSVKPGRGECILYGARQLRGHDRLAIAAIGRRAIIESVPRLWENGAYWYTELQKAVGFAGSEVVQLQVADIEGFPCQTRLSWNLDSRGGYRAGCATALQNDDTWEKVVMFGPCSCAVDHAWSSTAYSICAPAVQQVPHGVQHQFNPASLGLGWKVHYEKAFRPSMATSDVQPGRGDCVLWGIKENPGDVKLYLAAVGRRVLVQTQSVFWENGVFWYTQKDKSAGFAGLEVQSLGEKGKGNYLDLDTAQCESRLSWALNGYYNNRAGCAMIRGGVTWQKVVMYGPCICGAGQGSNSTSDSICVACPAGKTSLAGGASLGNRCTNCSAGSFAQVNGTTRCIACAVGKAVNTSGASACFNCPSGKYADKFHQSECTPCKPGLFTVADPRARAGSTNCTTCAVATFASLEGTTQCSACAPGHVAGTRGASACILCPMGKVANAASTGCIFCGSNSFKKTGELYCTQCSDLQFGLLSPDTEESGDWKACTLSWVLIISLTTIGVVIIVGISWWRWRIRTRKHIVARMEIVLNTDDPNVEVMLQKALRQGQTASLKHPCVNKCERMLKVLQDRFGDLEALLQVVDEGHLKLIRGSWLANEASGHRLRRQQDLPQEAFWSAQDLRVQLPFVVIIGVSYCWLHPVHPDPRGEHLRVLRHALQLRLQVCGPGRVHDVALFVDFMSLTQKRDDGDTLNPAEVGFMSLEDENSFDLGVRHVSIPFANQFTEVWLLKWVPTHEPHKYSDRCWSTFEESLACLSKDHLSIVEVSPDVLKLADWTEVFERGVVGRRPPIIPKTFSQAMDQKSIYRIADRAFLKETYKETFKVVAGSTTSLWFVALKWTDVDVHRLVSFLPFCHKLEQLLLSSNHFTHNGALELAQAARSCPSLRGIDLSDNLIDISFFAEIAQAFADAGKDPTQIRLSAAGAMHPWPKPIFTCEDDDDAPRLNPFALDDGPCLKDASEERAQLLLTSSVLGNSYMAPPEVTSPQPPQDSPPLLARAPLPSSVDTGQTASVPPSQKSVSPSRSGISAASGEPDWSPKCISAAALPVVGALEEQWHSNARLGHDIVMFFIQNALKGCPCTYIAENNREPCTAEYFLDKTLQTFTVAVQIYPGAVAANLTCPLQDIKGAYALEGEDDGRIPPEVVERLEDDEKDLLIRIVYHNKQGDVRSFCLLEESRNGRDILLECLRVVSMYAKHELRHDLQLKIKSFMELPGKTVSGRPASAPSGERKLKAPDPTLGGEVSGRTPIPKRPTSAPYGRQTAC